MWQDPIVEEVHAIREQLLAQFAGDLHKYCEFVKAQPVASFAPRKPPPSNATLPDVSKLLKLD